MEGPRCTRTLHTGCVCVCVEHSLGLRSWPGALQAVQAAALPSSYKRSRHLAVCCLMLIKSAVACACLFQGKEAVL